MKLLGRAAVVLACIAVLSLVGPVASANAATITHSAAFSVSETVGIGGSFFQFTGSDTQTQTIQLARFDTGLGTLTGVQFDLVSGTSSATRANVDISEPDAQFGLDASADGSSTFSVVEAVTGSTLFTESQTELASCTSSFTYCDTNNTGTPFSFGGTTSASSVAGFGGPGVFDVDLSLLVSVTGTFFFSGPIGGVGGNGNAFFDALYDGNLAVTYTYTPVPEPTAAVLVCLGMGFLAVRQRSL